MRWRKPLSRHGPQVESRVSRREPIFKDDADRQRFVETLGEACAKSSSEVHAFVFMPNHLPAPSTADRFSSGGRDAAAEPGRRDEMVSAHPTQCFQPTPQAVRPTLLRSRLNRNDAVKSGEHTPLACGLRRRAANFSTTAVLHQTVGRFARFPTVSLRRAALVRQNRRELATATKKMLAKGP